MGSKKMKTSSKDSKRNIVLSDGTKIEATNNTASMAAKGKVGKNIVPKKPFSTETGKCEDDYVVEDNYDSLEYPPPSKHPVFRKFWADSIDNIANRSNFNPSHLLLLEALCRLRVELQELDKFIQNNGHVFRVVTIMGETRRTYPEVNERHKVLSHIANYSKLLDLTPKKDKSRAAPRKADEDEWK